MYYNLIRFEIKVVFSANATLIDRPGKCYINQSNQAFIIPYSIFMLM